MRQILDHFTAALRATTPETRLSADGVLPRFTVRDAALHPMCVLRDGWDRLSHRSPRTDRSGTKLAGVSMAGMGRECEFADLESCRSA